MSNDSSWQALAEALAVEVRALPPGARVPTHRQLVARFGASATTVARALADLGHQGLIESRPGSGSFRSADRDLPPRIDTAWQDAALGLSPVVGAEPSPLREYDASALATTVGTHGADVVDLSGGYLHPDLQPADLLAKALARVGRRAEAWERPEAAGLPALRDWFAAGIGGGLSRHDVLVSAGGQAALALTMRAIGSPGDPVIVETPTYPGTLAAARAAGLRVVPVPLDRDGIHPEHLDRALGQTGARLVVIQPAFQNPTGVSLTPDRQREVLDLAARHGAFVVEDDFARGLTHADAPPLPPPLVGRDEAGAVVHIRSLTKTTSPNLRVAGLAARGPVLRRLRDAHLVDTMFVPAVLQQTALEVVSAPGWSRTQRALAEALAHRRSVAVDAVRRHLGPDALNHVARGGYHLWLRLPDGLDDQQVGIRALQHGVAVAAGSTYETTRMATDHLRISYVATPSPAEVGVGIERLGRALGA